MDAAAVYTADQVKLQLEQSAGGKKGQSNIILAMTFFLQRHTCFNNLVSFEM